MPKEALIQSARLLTAPDSSTSKALKEMAESLAGDLSKRMGKRHDLEELIGVGNQPTMEMNHVNHFNYISSLAALYDPASFVETVIWVFRTYMSRGFTPRYWIVMLPEAKGVLKEHLPQDQCQQVEGIYTWLCEHVDDFVRLSNGTASFYETIGSLQGLMDDKHN